MLHIIIVFNPLVTLLHHHHPSPPAHIDIHASMYITRSIPQRQEWDTCPVRIQHEKLGGERERMALLLTMQ